MSFEAQSTANGRLEKMSDFLDAPINHNSTLEI